MTVTIFQLMEVYPRRNEWFTSHDAVHRPFFRGMPPSADKLLCYSLNNPPCNALWRGGLTCDKMNQ